MRFLLVLVPVFISQVNTGFYFGSFLFVFQIKLTRLFLNSTSDWFVMKLARAKAMSFSALI